MMGPVGPMLWLLVTNLAFGQCLEGADGGVYENVGQALEDEETELLAPATTPSRA